MGLREPDDFWLLLNAILIGGFLGGRAGFLASEGGLPAGQGLVFPLTSGFSAFGVFAGMALGLLALCRLRRLPPGPILDHLCAILPIWIAAARLGCFLTGCCYGRPAGPSWPWTVTFTDPGAALPRALLGVPLHPAQLYEALGDLGLGLLLLRGLGGAGRDGWPAGTCAAVFLAGYGILRFGMEALRGDTVAGIGMLTLGQLQALGFVLLAWAWQALERRSRLDTM